MDSLEAVKSFDKWARKSSFPLCINIVNKHKTCKSDLVSNTAESYSNHQA